MGLCFQRREGQEVHFFTAEGIVVIRIEQVRSDGTIQIHIEAPRDLRVVRGEIASEVAPAKRNRPRLAAPANDEPDEDNGFRGTRADWENWKARAEPVVEQRKRPSED